MSNHNTTTTTSTTENNLHKLKQAIEDLNEQQAILQVRMNLEENKVNWQQLNETLQSIQEQQKNYINWLDEEVARNMDIESNHPVIEVKANSDYIHKELWNSYKNDNVTITMRDFPNQPVLQTYNKAPVVPIDNTVLSRFPNMENLYERSPPAIYYSK